MSIGCDTKCDRCYEMPADTYYMGYTVCFTCRESIAKAIKKRREES